MSARPARGVSTSCQVTILPCIPTHPHDEGVGKVSPGFIGARDGVDEGIGEGSLGCLVTQGGAEVGLEDRINGGFSQ